MGHHLVGGLKGHSCRICRSLGLGGSVLWVSPRRDWCPRSPNLDDQNPTVDLYFWNIWLRNWGIVVDYCFKLLDDVSLWFILIYCITLYNIYVIAGLQHSPWIWILTITWTSIKSLHVGARCREKGQAKNISISVNHWFYFDIAMIFDKPSPSYDSINFNHILC